MSIKELLFSFQGRIGRKVFWTWNLFYYVMILGFAKGITVLFPSQAYLILPVFLLFVLLPDLAITAKRWHDRGKSSWWLLLNVPVIVGRMAVPAADPGVVVDTTTMEMIASLAALVCGGWILIECGFMKGQPGANQYGQEPAR